MNTAHTENPCQQFCRESFEGPAIIRLDLRLTVRWLSADGYSSCALNSSLLPDICERNGGRPSLA